MTAAEFASKVREHVKPGDVFDNPGDGTSVVLSITETNFRYQRGKSPISVGIHGLFDAYAHFSGRKVLSSDLKKYAPAVFDSNARPAGHNCNCTMLFMILERLGLAGEIEGTGKKGDSFWTTIG